MEHKCKFCNKNFDKGFQLGGHTAGCERNPNNNRNKISETMKGKVLSDLHKSNIKKGMRKAVLEGRQKTPKPGGICNHFDIANTEGIIQHIQGSWEKKFVEFLNSKNIHWQRNKIGYKYYFEDEEKTFFPDFYLKDYDAYVEVKGYQTSKDLAKWKDFPFKLFIVKRDELKNLENWVQSLSGISTGLISRG